jgi:hypothetical protein
MRWIRPLLLASIVVFASLPTSGRFIIPQTYSELTEAADLVVIGQPAKIRTTQESIQVADGLVVRGVETSVKVLAVLKGHCEESILLLFHVRPEPIRTPGSDTVITHPDAPSVLEFDEGLGNAYLMFLREDGKRFVPAGGQMDPVYSVIELPKRFADLP